MGCCSRFHTTWWPGNSEGVVIDPDKEFDYQRRISIIKRVICVAAVLALLSGAIYLLVHVLSPSSKQKSLSSDKSDKATAEPLQDLPIIFIPDADDDLSNTSSLISHFNDNTDKSTTPDSINISTDIFPVGPKENITHDHESSAGSSGHSSPMKWCTSQESLLTCVALSKDLKTLTTFQNHNSSKNGTVEGFILVKMRGNHNNSAWHPYCKESWTLEMGYQLCNGLEFKKMQQLTTIDILELKQRLRNIGKDVVLEPQSKNLLLLQRNGTEPQTPNHKQSHPTCRVGYITCSAT